MRRARWLRRLCPCCELNRHTPSGAASAHAATTRQLAAAVYWRLPRQRARHWPPAAAMVQHCTPLISLRHPQRVGAHGLSCCSSPSVQRTWPVCRMRWRGRAGRACHVNRPAPPIVSQQPHTAGGPPALPSAPRPSVAVAWLPLSTAVQNRIRAYQAAIAWKLPPSAAAALPICLCGAARPPSPACPALTLPAAVGMPSVQPMQRRRPLWCSCRRRRRHRLAPLCRPAPLPRRRHAKAKAHVFLDVGASPGGRTVWRLVHHGEAVLQPAPAVAPASRSLALLAIAEVCPEDLPPCRSPTACRRHGGGGEAHAGQRGAGGRRLQSRHHHWSQRELGSC